MASQLREDAGRMNVLMAFRFEFDPANKILLLRAEGRMTDELLGKLYPEVERYWAATHAGAPCLYCCGLACRLWFGANVSDREGR
jgi:hypothetical protein